MRMWCQTTLIPAQWMAEAAAVYSWLSTVLLVSTEPIIYFLALHITEPGFVVPHWFDHTHT